MSSLVRFELNSAGVVELLKSSEMQAILRDYAGQVQNRCTAGSAPAEEFKTNVRVSGDRAKAKVYASTQRAKNSNRAHRTLQKALWG